MPRTKRAWQDVLRYDCQNKPSQSTLKRYYNEWRRENGLPAERCDNPECVFYKKKLEWNGKPLTLTLDHRNGNPYENSPSNLRYLCPNCDSQLPTKGGRNKGRVRARQEMGYTLVDAVSKFLEHFWHIWPNKVGVEDRVSIKAVSPRQEEQAESGSPSLPDGPGVPSGGSDDKLL
jgi:hypothetical protein